VAETREPVLQISAVAEVRKCDRGDVHAQPSVSVITARALACQRPKPVVEQEIPQPVVAESGPNRMLVPVEIFDLRSESARLGKHLRRGRSVKVTTAEIGVHTQSFRRLTTHSIQGSDAG
jgi:hypothetical protein